MKRHHLSRFAVALSAMAAFTGAWAQSPEERATQVLDQLEAGQFEEVTATFDPQMQSLLTAEGLEQAWGSLPQQVGALQSRGTPAAAAHGPYQVVTVPLQYEHAALNAIISFDGEDRLAGLQFVPAQGAAAPAEAPAEPQEETTEPAR